MCAIVPVPEFYEGEAKQAFIKLGLLLKYRWNPIIWGLNLCFNNPRVVKRAVKEGNRPSARI